MPCLDFEELSQRSTLKRASRYIAFLEECLLRDDGMYDEETAAMVCRDEVNDNVMADDGKGMVNKINYNLNCRFVCNGLL